MNTLAYQKFKNKIYRKKVKKLRQKIKACDGIIEDIEAGIYEPKFLRLGDTYSKHEAVSYFKREKKELEKELAELEGVN